MDATTSTIDEPGLLQQFIARMTSAKSKESEDLAAIQAQLQLERAQLTNEIGSRLSSPLKTNGGKTTSKNNNPFSMSKGNNTSSPAPLFFSSSSPFNHRPATLGLGAEPSEQDRKQASSSSENARLKGALMGKRKRENEKSNHLEKDDDDDEEESKSYTLSKGKGKEYTFNEKGRGSTRTDPFSSKKGKGKVKSVEQQPALPKGTVADEPNQDHLAGLSKSARKKLRKKMKKEADATEEMNAMKEVESEVEAEIEAGAGAEKTELPIANEKAQTEEKAGGNPNSMTAHQKALMSHLSGARFRQINETLYTTTSSSAMSYIQGEPSKLREYHEGFREQVKSWPKVPVRQIAEIILKGQKQGQSGKQRSGRFAPGPLIIDLGAGEAILGKLLAKDATSSVRVLSYDLLDSEDGWVKGLDIAKLNGLPLPGTLGAKDEEAARVVDVAVFCLSLMGTNWIEMIMEASRVIRTNGELVIAEVSSRFDTKSNFIKIVSSLGFKLTHEDSSNSHFVLFEFVKLGKGKWDAKGLEDEQERKRIIEKGSSVLKPCIYKRR